MHGYEALIQVILVPVAFAIEPRSARLSMPRGMRIEEETSPAMPSPALLLVDVANLPPQCRGLA